MRVAMASSCCWLEKAFKTNFQFVRPTSIYSNWFKWTRSFNNFELESFDEGSMEIFKSLLFKPAQNYWIPIILSSNIGNQFWSEVGTNEKLLQSLKLKDLSATPPVCYDTQRICWCHVWVRLWMLEVLVLTSNSICLQLVGKVRSKLAFLRLPSSKA